MEAESPDTRMAPYDPEAPRVFEELAQVLEQMLPEGARIEHVGSTSIPGVAGKGIIDCLIIVQPDQAAQVAATVWEAGFDDDIEIRHPNQEWWYAAGSFVRPNGERRHVHMHISYAGAGFAADLVRFRDYLRARPEEARRYERLKRRWRREAGDDRRKFTSLKTPYVQGVLARARREESEPA